MVQKKVKPAPSLDKIIGEVNDIIEEARSKRRFFRRVLTNATRFDILKMFKRNKNKKEKTMDNQKTKKTAKKSPTIKVSTLVPWAIIVALVIAGVAGFLGVQYEKNRVAEINAAVSQAQVSKTNQQ